MFRIINGSKKESKNSDSKLKMKKLKIGDWVVIEKYVYGPVKITNINWFKNVFLCIAFNGDGEPSEDYEWNKIDEITEIITGKEEIAELEKELNSDKSSQPPLQLTNNLIPFVRPI